MGALRCRKGRPKSPPAGGYVAQLLSAGLVLLRLLAVGGGKQALAQAHGLRSDLHQLVVLDVFQSLFQGEGDGRRQLALSAELERWLPRFFVFSTFTTMSPSLADSPTIMPS